MVTDHQVRRLRMLVNREKTKEIAAAKAGMQSMRQDGLEKAKKGITTVEEVLRLTQEERK